MHLGCMLGSKCDKNLVMYEMFAVTQKWLIETVGCKNPTPWARVDLRTMCQSGCSHLWEVTECWE